MSGKIKKQYHKGLKIDYQKKNRFEFLFLVENSLRIALLNE